MARRNAAEEAEDVEEMHERGGKILRQAVLSQILMTKTETGSDFTDIIDTNSKTDLPTLSIFL